MKEKNLLLRTLTCVIGVPLVLSLVYFVPQYNFILFSLFVVAFCFIGSLEMSKLLFKKTVPAAILGPLVPLVQYLQGVLDFNSSVPDLIFVLVLLLCFASEIKLGEKDDFDSSLARGSKNALIIIYPSYFISFFIRLMALPQVTAFAIISFLLLVFCNDMLAYIFGRLFGKTNQGVFKVSPKKSVAGFVGSFVGSIGISFMCFALFKDYLPSFSTFYKILLGACMSLTANAGDLLESVFKRSAKIKDSGNIIPGRGGALDCLDSAIASCPVFFIIFNLVLESV